MSEIVEAGAQRISVDGGLAWAAVNGLENSSGGRACRVTVKPTLAYGHPT